jgi:hypothetical protein
MPRPQKVKERDHQSSNDGCQSPKPILLVVVGRGPQNNGIQCRVVAAYKAYLIKWSDIHEMAKRLRNPRYSEVKQPDERWFHCYTSLDTYYCGMEKQVFKYYWIEGTVLCDRGKDLSGWEKAYFAYQIGKWFAKELFVKAEK